MLIEHDLFASARKLVAVSGLSLREALELMCRAELAPAEPTDGLVAAWRRFFETQRSALEQARASVAQPRLLGVLGLTTSLKGRKNLPKLMPSAAKIARQRLHRNAALTAFQPPHIGTVHLGAADS